MKPAEPSPLPAGALPAVARLNLVLLGLGGCALVAKLAREWTDNPDLAHGWVTPLACALLLWESRRTGPIRWVGPGGLAAWAGGAGLAAAFVLLGAGCLLAVAVDWSNSLIDFVFATAFGCLVWAALAAYADRRLRLIPLNWCAAVAALIWPLAAPLPPGTYLRLSLALQLGISGHVVQALHILGIAARRDGNIIELARGTVGVEEACSGVRSLISCLMVALLLSVIIRRPARRVWLVLAAAPLAILMNFLRSLVLTLLVNSGTDIARGWHAFTGYAVLVLTASALGGFALLLARREAGRPAASPPSPVPPAPPPAPALQWILLSALLVALIATSAFRLATRPALRGSGAPPDLAALIPAAAPGWSVTTSRDLYQFSAVLRTQTLAQRTYVRSSPAGPVEVTIYVAYWQPGQAPVSLVATHTPDACWPGAGWTAVPTPQPREALAADGRILAVAESRLFQQAHLEQHVWFWHLYDAHPIAYQDPRSVPALLQVALRYGIKNGGDQLFIRLSSNRPWNEISSEPFVTSFFAATRPLGL